MPATRVWYSVRVDQKLVCFGSLPSDLVLIVPIRQRCRCQGQDRPAVLNSQAESEED